MDTEERRPETEAQDEGRRAFLANAGKFAAVTTPAVAMLMSTSLEANAMARSCYGHAKGPKLRKHLHGKHADLPHGRGVGPQKGGHKVG